MKKCPYREQWRLTRQELADNLDILETQYVETIDVWWDNIMQEWVLDCLINIDRRED